MRDAIVIAVVAILAIVAGGCGDCETEKVEECMKSSPYVGSTGPDDVQRHAEYRKQCAALARDACD